MVWPSHRSFHLIDALDCTGRSQSGLKWLRRINQEDTGISTKDEEINNKNILRLDYNTKQRYQNFRFFVPPDVRSRLPIPGGYEHGGPWLYTFMPKPGKEQKYFVVDRLDGHRSEYCRTSQLKREFEELKSCQLRWHSVAGATHHSQRISQKSDRTSRTLARTSPSHLGCSK